ncbi:MAG: hypothetical protein WDO73_27400 [Ignavibacteriota bacterium]
MQLNPKHWPAMLAMASVQIQQGAPEKAMETARAAMKFVPANYRWVGHVYLGRANLEAHKVSDAISELEAAIRQKPSSADAHLLLAQALSGSGPEDGGGERDAGVRKGEGGTGSPRRAGLPSIRDCGEELSCRRLSQPRHRLGLTAAIGDGSPTA